MLRKILRPFAYVVMEFQDALQDVQQAKINRWNDRMHERIAQEHESPCSVYLSPSGYCNICSNKLRRKSA